MRGKCERYLLPTMYGPCSEHEYVKVVLESSNVTLKV